MREENKKRKGKEKNRHLHVPVPQLRNTGRSESVQQEKRRSAVRSEPIRIVAVSGAQTNTKNAPVEK